VSILITALQVLIWVIIADAVLSWVAPSTNKLPRSITSKITGPLYAPVRKIIGSATGGIDFSPLVVILLLSAAQRLLLKL